ncbi:DUF1194 domain-containing protein [Arvimicrobium flavum]|uniref:DUF1194 domain-containing protein n=1 Tax=Arvimicrobium flavum TaxID=3393320 RepID=UPI00237C3041|nr:DUF1194 domain-containing protein [Mesorhizobium shangrilense]
MARRLLPIAAVAVLSAPAGSLIAASGDQAVDLELVLAVDISRSMDPEEFAVQRAGYVAALRHPDFIRAIGYGANGRIALTYFEWAGSVHASSQVEWRIIDGAESANAFADTLERRPAATFRGTSVSAALRHAAMRLEENDIRATRKVIDISGDGPNNIGGPVVEARKAAISQGITINGLPILIRPSPSVGDLDAYYAECVTGGPGSFVLPVRAASEFANAIRRKLILEVSGADLPAVVKNAAQSPVDCQIGEKLRRTYSDPYLPELDR